MITVTFKRCNSIITGFNAKGHSGYSEEGSDIICAFVSSAVIMAANTITDIQHLSAEVAESDGFVNLNLSQEEAVKASDILDGLRLHLNALSEQYPEYVKLKISEV